MKPRRPTRRDKPRPQRSVAAKGKRSIPFEQERVIVALSRSEALAKGDLVEAFRQIVRAAALTAKTRRVGIWRYGEGRLLLHCVEQYDAARRRFARGEVLATTEYPAYFAALDNEVVVAAGNASTDPRTRELAAAYLSRHAIRSMLDAPILVGGRLWGVLCHEAVGEIRHWTIADKLFARALADTAALAIESAERREAADTLRRSESYFRALIENSSELVAVLNPDGTVRYASPSNQPVLGYRPEELVGRSVFDLVHPHEAPRLAEELRRLRRAPGTTHALEARLRHRDGTWRYVEGVAKNLVEDEAVGGIVVSARDATERHWAEAEVRALLGVAQDVGGTLDLSDLLRRVEQRARDVLHSAFAASFVRHDEGELRLASHLGASPDLLGVLRRAESAEALDRVTSSARAIAIRRGADNPPGSADLARELGFEHLALAPLVARGKRLGVLVLGRHWAEPFVPREVGLLSAIAKELAAGVESATLYRQESEAARFSATLLHVGYELMSASDHSGMLQRLCQLTAELLPCDFSRTLFLDEDHGTVRLAASYGETAEEREFIQQMRISRQEALPIFRRLERDELLCESPYPELATRFGWKETLLVGLRHGGRVVGAQTAGRRRTSPFSPAEKRLARGIAHMASLSLQNLLLVSRLEQANRVKSDFISMMSHELRTPLNIILGYTGLLAERAYGSLNEEQAGILRRIERGANSLLDLITTTLDLNRLQRGDVAIEVGEVDLPALIRAVESQCRALHQRAEVGFRCDLPADLPPLRTDGGKLRVIVANLVANAFRFTERGEVCVGVRAHAGGLEINVADTGIGIEPGARALIFEAFRQAEAHSPRPEGGVGLGLYIVRHLLELLHGSVEVESEVGRGSTFRVWLPLDLYGDGGSAVSARTARPTMPAEAVGRAVRAETADPTPPPPPRRRTP